MADKKISELTSITGANVSDTNDTIAIVDSSAGQTKKITRGELFKDVDGATFAGPVKLDASTGGATLSLVSGNNVTNAGQKIAFFGANRSETDEEMASIRGLLSSNNGGAGNVQQGELAFSTSGSEVLRVDRDGNVGIGTGNPQSKLDVDGGATFSDSVTLGGGQNYLGATNSSALYFNRTDGSSYINFGRVGDAGLIFRDGDNTTVARVEESGTSAPDTKTLMTRQKGDSRYTQISSDKRLKENISEMEDVGGLIDRLRPVRFNWKENDNDPKPEGLMYGMIAQEVSKVAPEIALGSEETTVGIDALSVVSVLVKEVQELRKRVAEIENT